MNQRVVTFHDKGTPLRGTAHFTGDKEDSRGHVQSVVGLELVGIIPKVMDSLLIVYFFFFVTPSTIVFILGCNLLILVPRYLGFTYLNVSANY